MVNITKLDSRDIARIISEQYKVDPEQVKIDVSRELVGSEMHPIKKYVVTATVVRT